MAYLDEIGVETLTAEIKDYADDTYSSKWTLLWENASPTSEFAAQTVSLNLLGYQDIKIIFNLVSTDTVQYITYYLDLNSLQQEVQAIRDIQKSGIFNVLSRPVSFNNNGITFGDAVTKMNTSTSSTTTPTARTDVMVPIKIYAK